MVVSDAAAAVELLRAVFGALGEIPAMSTMPTRPIIIAHRIIE
jgi:hypothetical protein